MLRLGMTKVAKKEFYVAAKKKKKKNGMLMFVICLKINQNEK